MTKLEDVDAHYYGSLYTVAALDGQTRQHLEVGAWAARSTGSSYYVWPPTEADHQTIPIMLRKSGHALVSSLLQECLLEVVDDGKHHCVMLVGHNKVRSVGGQSGGPCLLMLHAPALLVGMAETCRKSSSLADLQWSWCSRAGLGGGCLFLGRQCSEAQVC